MSFHQPAAGPVEQVTQLGGLHDLERQVERDHFAQYPYAALVLHINREAIHHMAEVALLRDLYREQK